MRVTPPPRATTKVGDRSVLCPNVGWSTRPEPRENTTDPMKHQAFKFATECYDITVGWRIAAGRPPTRASVKVAEHIGFLVSGRPMRWRGRMMQPTEGTPWVRVDRAHAMSPAVDLTVPLLVGEFPDAYFVLDGWHRIYKAHQQEVAELDAVFLTEEETDFIRFQCP